MTRPTRGLNTPIRVILADDHEILHQAVRVLLEQRGFEVIDEASDSQETVRLASFLRPDLAILDIVMPLTNGIDAAREILRESPRMKVVLLTMHTEERYVLYALETGIPGYVLKTESISNLVHVIDNVTRGSVCYSSRVSQNIVQAYLKNEEIPRDPLAHREHKILHLIAGGKTTREAANPLGISPTAAERRRKSVESKLDARTTAGLGRYAIRRGVIRP